jgi:peptidoglycan/LPS O-acetylase OafA/YrhL
MSGPPDGIPVTPPAPDHAENNFTALRLLLALLVVLGHFRLLAGVSHPDWPFCYASAAVDCFFVVSGYLVSLSFDRDADLKRFYVRRFCRIYPLYLAVVLAQTIILGCLQPPGPDSGGSLLRYVLVNAAFANFLQYDVGSGVLAGLVNPSLNPSLWTLKIEFGFYLLLPFLWKAVERWRLPLLAAIFAGSAAYYWGWTEAGHPELARQLPGQLQFFVLGVAAYRYRRHLTIGRRAGTVLATALAVLLTALLAHRPPLVYPLVVGALVVAAALATPRLHWRRDISYGVYLLHGPAIQLLLLVGMYRADWLGLLTVFAVVIPLAFFCEQAIEAPGIACGRRLGQWLARRESAAVGRDTGLAAISRRGAAD